MSVSALTFSPCRLHSQCMDRGCNRTQSAKELKVEREPLRLNGSSRWIELVVTNPASHQARGGNNGDTLFVQRRSTSIDAGTKKTNKRISLHYSGSGHSWVINMAPRRGLQGCLCQSSRESLGRSCSYHHGNHIQQGADGEPQNKPRKLLQFTVWAPHICNSNRYQTFPGELGGVDKCLTRGKSNGLSPMALYSSLLSRSSSLSC